MTNLIDQLFADAMATLFPFDENADPAWVDGVLAGYLRAFEVAARPSPEPEPEPEEDAASLEKDYAVTKKKSEGGSTRIYVVTFREKVIGYVQPMSANVWQYQITFTDAPSRRVKTLREGYKRIRDSHTKAVRERGLESVWEH